MTIDVSGVPGSRETLWILSGESEAISNSLVHTDNVNFFPGDTAIMRPIEEQNQFFINDGRYDWGVTVQGTWLVNGIDPIQPSDVLIQPQIIADGDVRNISSISHRKLNFSDSLGIRVTSPALSYSLGDRTSWSGIFTIPVGIEELIPGRYVNSESNGDSTGLEFTTPGDFELRVFGQDNLLDYGDAPFSYRTLSADQGPRHSLEGPILGQFRDGELNGFISSDADGDDNIGVSDDEDGIVFVPQSGFDRNSGVSSSILVTVLNSPAAYEVWIDWNVDGQFSNPEELAASGVLSSDGTHNVSLAVPATATIGTTFLRARVYSPGDQLGSPTGLASSGEVEDYSISIMDSTLLDLVAFESTVTHDDIVELHWITATEVKVAGFNIWRVSIENNSRTSRQRVNSALIPSKGLGLLGARYQLRDEPGYGEFLYELEELETGGQRFAHATSSASVYPHVSLEINDRKTLVFSLHSKPGWRYHLQSSVIFGEMNPIWVAEEVVFDQMGAASLSIDLSQAKVFRILATSENSPGLR